MKRQGIKIAVVLAVSVVAIACGEKKQGGNQQAEAALEEVKEEAKKGYLSELHARLYPFFEKEEHSLSDYLSDYECFVFDEKQSSNELEYLRKRENSFFSKSVKEGTSLEGEKRFATHFSAAFTATVLQPD